jgi:hypothetical protein
MGGGEHTRCDESGDRVRGGSLPGIEVDAVAFRHQREERDDQLE